MANQKLHNKYCGVYECLSSTATKPGISFFSLPTDQDRNLKWLQLIGREDLIGSKPLNNFVCEIHFNPQDVCVRNVRKVLKKNCYPCLHLPTQIKDDKEIQTEPHISDGFAQTETNLQNTTTSSSQTKKVIVSDNEVQTPASLSGDTAKKRKMEFELANCKKRLRDYESMFKSKKSSRDIFNQLCDRLLSKDMAELVKLQTILKPGHRGNRYSHAYKIFCLNLYYRSPQAYRLLQNTISLPCTSTLKILNIPMTTEINDKLMAALKMKVINMSEREKQCSLVMGTMSLKPNLFYNIKNDKIIGFHEVQGVQSPSPAKHALVVLVRGMFVKWYQPIGFSLLSECSDDVNISLWIDEIISKLYEIGLKIRACVTDLSSLWLQESKNREISVEKTHFTVNNHKIYYIFDAPNLIKLLRNNFMTYDFHFQNGSVAKFEHVIKFYGRDKKRNYKQAHKLSKSHICPKKFEMEEVRYATQLLSRSVASGLSTFIDFNVIDESARDTVEFIQMMNDLFDTLNSSNLCTSYLYKNAFSGTEHQKAFFNKMLNFFQTLSLRNPKNREDVTKNVKFIDGFQITIHSILQLHEDLHQEGYPYLLTRRLNQEIIKNLNGKSKPQNEIATKPTSRQFILAFKKKFNENLKRAPKEGKCSGDLTEFLVHLSDHKISENEFKESDSVPALLAVKNDEPENTLHDIACSDYEQFDMPKKKSFYYVCGALFKKCLDRHNNCELLTSYLDANKRAYRVENSKDSTERNSLVVPPDFVKNIERMEQVFRRAFEKEHMNSKIGMSIYEELKHVDFSLPCPCFPRVYLQKLFVRMRIYFTLSSNNKAFRSCRNRRDSFSIPNM